MCGVLAGPRSAGERASCLCAVRRRNCAERDVGIRVHPVPDRPIRADPHDGCDCGRGDLYAVCGWYLRRVARPSHLPAVRCRLLPAGDRCDDVPPLPGRPILPVEPEWQHGLLAVARRLLRGVGWRLPVHCLPSRQLPAEHRRFCLYQLRCRHGSGQHECVVLLVVRCRHVFEFARRCLVHSVCRRYDLVDFELRQLLVVSGRFLPVGRRLHPMQPMRGRQGAAALAAAGVRRLPRGYDREHDWSICVRHLRHRHHLRGGRQPVYRMRGWNVLGHGGSRGMPSVPTGQTG